MNHVKHWLNVCFAIMVGLSGLTFAGSPEVGTLPFVAVFFAAFGLVFVDLLRWFALPTSVAYVALAVIAFYTTNRFVTIGALSPEPQMVAVAELLVLVQSVLMLQVKTRRIYEQLAVFSLLQLIVAAIFNNAITYGLLLVPLCASCVGALSLLQICATSEDGFDEKSNASSSLRVHSAESHASYVRFASVVPRAGWTMIAPAVLVVGFVFFYALPRTNQAAQHGIGGAAQVGFSSQVRLGQIGQMLQNSEIAMRIVFSDRQGRSKYDVVGNFYVRGAVLESYDPAGAFSGTWSAIETDDQMAAQVLPARPLVGRRNDQQFHDDLVVHLQVSSMRGDSLFSMPPYYFDSSGPDVAHHSDRWLIKRRVTPLLSRNSQIAYRFGCQSFKDGIQSDLLRRFAEGERIMRSPIEVAESMRDDASGKSDSPIEPAELGRMQSLFNDQQRSADRYRDSCLVYDENKIPSARRVAETALGRMGREATNPEEIARQLERFLSRGNAYQYTLNLTMPTIVGMDPIEQFLTIDRRGNCTYFASALVLMLRSQGIPARMVVGFNTDEFNSIGGHYVARQSHAHGWVEALIQADDLQPNEVQFPLDEVPEYWLRLDPTPGGGGSNLSTGGSVADVFDLAQDMWTNYVVDADSADRRRELSATNDTISGTYQAYYEWMRLKMARVRAGELGAGALADGSKFSWPAAVGVIAMLLVSLFAYQFGIPGWLLPRGDRRSAAAQVAKPSVPFFAETVDLLESVGMHRRAGQTAKEYTVDSAMRLSEMQLSEKGTDAPSRPIDENLRELTSAFYRERFGAQWITRGGQPFAPGERMIATALRNLRETVAGLRGASPKPSSTQTTPGRRRDSDD